MLRIQFDGLTLELGRDRSREPTALISAAMPWVMDWLTRRGFMQFFRDEPPPPPADAGEPN